MTLAPVQPPSRFQPRAEAPLTRARSLVHLRHERRDVEEALCFYTDFGLELAERVDGAVHLRAAGGGPICLILEPGPHDVLVGIGIEVESEVALRSVASKVGGQVEQRREPGGGLVLRLQDPAGLGIELLHGVERAPAREAPAPVPSNSFGRPARINPGRGSLVPPGCSGSATWCWAGRSSAGT